MAYSGAVPRDSQSPESSSERKREQPAIHGQMYEMKMCALLWLRGLNESLQSAEFRLQTNMADTAAPDDVVFQVRVPERGWQTYFIQLEHASSDNVGGTSISKESLLSATLQPGLALKKYYEQSVDLKKTFQNGGTPLPGDYESCHFGIFTNAPLCDQGAGVVLTTDIHNPGDKYFNLSRSNANLTESFINEMYTAIKAAQKERERDQKNKNKAMDKLLTGSEKDVKTFLRGFKIFAGQPSEHQLNVWIKKELQDCCQKDPTGFMAGSLQLFGIDAVFLGFLVVITQWWTTTPTRTRPVLDQDSPLLKNALDEAFTIHSRGRVQALVNREQEKYTIEDLPFMAAMEEYKSLQDACVSSLSFVSVLTHEEQVGLTASRLLQVLDARKDSYLFLGMKCLQDNLGETMSAWMQGETHLLVIVDDQSQSGNETKKNRTCSQLAQVLQEHPTKRVVLVSSPSSPYTTELNGNIHLEGMLDKIANKCTDDVIEDIFKAKEVEIKKEVDEQVQKAIKGVVDKKEKEKITEKVEQETREKVKIGMRKQIKYDVKEKLKQETCKSIIENNANGVAKNRNDM